MEDLFLIFQNEKESFSILYNIVPAEYKLGITGKPTKTIKIESYFIPKYQNIDVIGTVYQRPSTPTPDDYVPIPYPVPNFGVNIRLLDDEDIEPLRPYLVKPKEPMRLWATDNTLPTD